MKKNNEVIIIGGCHHNMLGVIRAFGEKGINPNIIITSKNNDCYVKKSKYVKKCDIVLEEEKEILNILFTKYNNLDIPPVLIPTSDFSALVIDRNLDKLKGKFIVPNIKDTQNLVEKHMNKFFQYELVTKSKIKMAKSWNLNLNEDENIPEDIIYPCILKPLVSAFAKKSDITICKNEKELESAINKFKKLKYYNSVLQEYIDFDQEYGFIGCCHGKNVILPGIIKKSRIYPAKRGNVSFGKIVKISDTKINFEPLFNLIKKLNYSGMFDIEIFAKDNYFYLNEINFRNSGNTYLYTYRGVYIVYLWYLMVCGIDISNEITKVEKEFYFEDELLELKQLKSKNINLVEWFKSLKKSKISFLLNKKDIKPVFFKLIYSISRRIKHEK